MRTKRSPLNRLFDALLAASIGSIAIGVVAMAMAHPTAVLATKDTVAPTVDSTMANAVAYNGMATSLGGAPKFARSPAVVGKAEVVK